MSVLKAREFELYQNHYINGYNVTIYPEFAVFGASSVFDENFQLIYKWDVPLRVAKIRKCWGNII